MFHIALVLGLFGAVLPFPFDLTDNYIKEFEHGIEKLKKISEEHVFEEKNYDFEKHNETEAISGID